MGGGGGEGSCLGYPKYIHQAHGFQNQCSSQSDTMWSCGVPLGYIQGPLSFHEPYFLEVECISNVFSQVA